MNNKQTSSKCATARASNKMLSIVAGSVVALFYACADDGASSSSDELLSTEDSIAALHASGAEAQAAAKACFDTFKTCEESAAGGSTTCRDQLKACLPDAPPVPQGCGGDHGERGDGGAKSDAGVAPAPAPTGDAGRGPRAGGDDGRGRGGDGGASRSGDGGVSHAGPQGPGQGFGGQFGGQSGAGGFGGFGPGRGGEHGGICGGFDFPRGALGVCRDDAERSMGRGMGCDGARAQHQSCMSHSFDDALGKLCKKANELCAKQGAPADVCGRITSACVGVGSHDGGTPTPTPAGDAGR